MKNSKKEELIKIFQNAKTKANPEMASTIWRSIIIRDKRLRQFKLWGFSCIGFASLVGLFPAIEILLDDLTRSGLYEYFSLIFQNGGSIVSYWKELIFSIAQSLPIMSIVFTLSLIFVFFLSLRYVLRQIDKNQLMNFAPLSV